GPIHAQAQWPHVRTSSSFYTVALTHPTASPATLDATAPMADAHANTAIAPDQWCAWSSRSWPSTLGRGGHTPTKTRMCTYPARQRSVTKVLGNRGSGNRPLHRSEAGLMQWAS